MQKEQGAGASLAIDQQYLAEGFVLFRSALEQFVNASIGIDGKLTAEAHAEGVRVMAEQVITQFIDLVDVDPEIDQWTMQVLHELTKDAELGKYAAEVARLIRRERLG